MGRDFGDQSQGFGVKQADFVLINVLQPGKHLKGFDDNPFVRRCREWTRTLIGDGCAIDYAQLLEKVANRPNAVFPWHQDMQYWPKRSQASTRTCTFSLALTDADEANGCLRVIPGTGLTKELFNERSAVEDGQEIYEEKRAIVLPLTAKEKADITLLPVKRGDVSVRIRAARRRARLFDQNFPHRGCHSHRRAAAAERSTKNGGDSPPSAGSALGSRNALGAAPGRSPRPQWSCQVAGVVRGRLLWSRGHQWGCFRPTCQIPLLKRAHAPGVAVPVGGLTPNDRL